jgi:hypothetical protein
MQEVTDEDGHYWVHPSAECWLSDAWVSDELTGEGSIGEWNTRAAGHALDQSLSVLIKQYALDLRRNASGGDDYPYSFAKATADYLEELIKRAKGNCTCAQAGFPDSCDNCDGLAPRPLGLGDIVRMNERSPYFHDWKDATMKVVSLRLDPDGKHWVSVIEGDQRHRGNGVYDGETTDIDADFLTALSDTSTHQSAPERNPPHNSGERLPSSDAAVPGADTCKGK